jgi:serine/threonine kinase PknH
VGRYDTKPRTLPGPTTEADGRYLAAFQLAEGIANPYEVDPKLSHLSGAPAPDRKLAASAISGTGTPLVAPVLEKYGMITAYVVDAYSQRLQDFIKTRTGQSMAVLLTSFPNDDAAARAATDMEATDFAINPENQHLTIAGYPGAKAHYRPNYASIAVTMARRSLVVSVVVSDSTVQNAPDLMPLVQQLFDKQVPLMDGVLPAVEAALTSLPLDPDHMLSRVFVAGEQPKISDSYGSIGPRAAVFCEDSQPLKDGLFEQAGVDRCAYNIRDASVLLRAKDDTAASAVLPKLVEADRAEYIDHDVAPPDGLTDAKCFEQKQNIWADNANIRFQCMVSYGRYVAYLSSNEEKDVRQRAAAQYAILVNSA